LLASSVHLVELFLYSLRNAPHLICNLRCTRHTTPRDMRITYMPTRPHRRCKVRIRSGRSACLRLVVHRRGRRATPCCPSR
jgi:hypothetical protein